MLYSAQTRKLCDKLEGWDGWEMGGRFKREGTCVYLWLIRVDVRQKPTQYCKAIMLQLYYSAIKKKTFESVLMRWMKLEPIIHSEVSQKEKHQYSILMHIYGI